MGPYPLPQAPTPNPLSMFNCFLQSRVLPTLAGLTNRGLRGEFEGRAGSRCSPGPPLKNPQLGSKTTSRRVWSISGARTISRPALSPASISLKSTAFLSGKIITRAPARWAARSFSRMPLTGRIMPPQGQLPGHGHVPAGGPAGEEGNQGDGDGEPG